MTVPTATIPVWDPLLRLIHWSVAAGCLAELFIAQGSEPSHEWIGLAASALVVLRIAWGFVGSVHARFSDFVPAPATMVNYLKQWRLGGGRRYIGHNPAGAIMVLLLLAQVLVLGVTGWLMTTDAFWGVRWLQDFHEGLANVLLACIVLHVTGVLVESIRHRENLVLAMITGRKPAK